jgi:hypothetical protein
MHRRWYAVDVSLPRIGGPQRRLRRLARRDALCHRDGWSTRIKARGRTGHRYCWPLAYDRGAERRRRGEISSESRQYDPAGTSWVVRFSKCPYACGTWLDSPDSLAPGCGDLRERVISAMSGSGRHPAPRSGRRCPTVRANKTSGCNATSYIRHWIRRVWFDPKRATARACNANPLWPSLYPSHRVDETGRSRAHSLEQNAGRCAIDILIPSKTAQSAILTS